MAQLLGAETPSCSALMRTLLKSGYRSSGRSISILMTVICWRSDLGAA
jgi:hypothetical protein